jgi:hypothetical protein
MMLLLLKWMQLQMNLKISKFKAFQPLSMYKNYVLQRYEDIVVFL